MQAYEGSLKPGDTRLLLSPTSQFFQYFNSASGNAFQDAVPRAADPADKPDAPAEGAKLPEPATGEQSSGPPEGREALTRESPPAPQIP